MILRMLKDFRILNHSESLPLGVRGSSFVEQSLQLRLTLSRVIINFVFFFQVALQDNGTYTLTIYGGSAFPGQSLTIAFDIVVSRSESEPLQNSASGLTVAAFIFAIIITAALIAIVTWYCCKSRNISLQKFISLG